MSYVVGLLSVLSRLAYSVIDAALRGVLSGHIPASLWSQWLVLLVIILILGEQLTQDMNSVRVLGKGLWRDRKSQLVGVAAGAVCGLAYGWCMWQQIARAEGELTGRALLHGASLIGVASFNAMIWPCAIIHLVRRRIHPEWSHDGADQVTQPKVKPHRL